MKNEYYITGVGILSNYGYEHNDFCENINISNKPEEKIFDNQTFKVNLLNNFDAKSILGKKGIRFYNEEAKMAISAFEFAVNDSNKNFDDLGDETGIFYQSILPIKSNYNFNYDRIYEGGLYVNPSEFPLILPNSIPGYAAIRRGFKGINNTICLGEASFGYCLESAVDEINNGSIKYAFIGAAIDLCDEFMLILSKLGKNYKQYSLSEGAGYLLLENEKTIDKEKSKIYCRLISFENGFDSKINKGKVNTGTIIKLINKVLDKADLNTDDIDLIIPNMSFDKITNQSEFKSLAGIFGGKEIYLCDTKKIVGESFTVSQLNNIFLISGFFKTKNLLSSSRIDLKKVNGYDEIKFTSNKVDKLENILLISMNCFGHINAVIIQSPKEMNKS